MVAVVVVVPATVDDFERWLGYHSSNGYDYRKAARVLYLWHVEGWSLRQIGLDVGVGNQRVSQILAKAWRKIRQRCSPSDLNTFPQFRDWLFNC